MSKKKKDEPKKLTIPGMGGHTRQTGKADRPATVPRWRQHQNRFARAKKYRTEKKLEKRRKKPLPPPKSEEKEPKDTADGEEVDGDKEIMTYYHGVRWCPGCQRRRNFTELVTKEGEDDEETRIVCGTCGMAVARHRMKREEEQR